MAAAEVAIIKLVKEFFVVVTVLLVHLLDELVMGFIVLVYLILRIIQLLLYLFLTVDVGFPPFVCLDHLMPKHSSCLAEARLLLSELTPGVTSTVLRGRLSIGILADLPRVLLLHCLEPQEI
uniref:Uncharacterized protein n=1 Tax=Strombidium inclinatum TaxID=197538 RepID=A0A7S3MTI8_9SPIT